MVQVSHCLESGCRFLYLYDDEQSGRRYMGCMNKVFRVEIDFGLFQEAERTRLGFGGVKLTGRPLPQCRTTVERAYDGHSPAFDCVNPSFYEPRVGGLDEDDAALDVRGIFRVLGRVGGATAPRPAATRSSGIPSCRHSAAAPSAL